MWVQMSVGEIEQRRAKKVRVERWFYFGLCMFGAVLVSAVRSQYESNGYSLVSLKEFFYRLPACLVGAGIIFMCLCYYMKREKKSVLVCPACGKTASVEEAPICGCDKEILDLEEAKWIED